MKKNDFIELSIDDLSTDGSGIGHSDKMAVFVDGALPGELVRVKIIALKKNYAIGKLDEILENSPMRVEPPCPVYKKCGGCTLQHLAYISQLEYKQNYVKGCIERIGKLSIPVQFPLPSKNETRYRNKAAFPLQKTDGILKAGLYSRHSHNVVDIDDCLIQQKVVKIVMSQLRVWLVKYDVSIYDEATHKGLMRHIIIRTNSAGQIMVIFVINGDDIPHKKELLGLVKFVLPQIKSIMLNINKENTNVILGNKSTLLYGRAHISETIDGQEFMLGPASFLQVNTQQCEVLYKNLIRLLGLSRTETLLDLYSGVGTISLLCAPHVRKVYGIEIVEEAVDAARINAGLAGIENAVFTTGDVDRSIAAILAENETIDAVVVDPPRKGLSKELVSTITQTIKPAKIGYVSCDPATFARDLALFYAAGYKADTIQPVDMFPQTTHVECVTVLHKENC